MKDFIFTDDGFINRNAIVRIYASNEGTWRAEYLRAGEPHTTSLPDDLESVDTVAASPGFNVLDVKHGDGGRPAAIWRKPVVAWRCRYCTEDNTIAEPICAGEWTLQRDYALEHPDGEVRDFLGDVSYDSAQDYLACLQRDFDLHAQREKANKA